MEQLTSYVRQLKKLGLTLTEITDLCLAAGWSKTDIFQAVTSVFELPAPPVPPTLQRDSAKEKLPGSFKLWIAFEYILLFISLYVMAISLGVLLSVFVQYWFPDPAFDFGGYSLMYQYESMLTTIRGCIAALAVSWPLFTFFFYDVKKKELASPIVRDMVARKILIYLTLVVTFVVMTVNLIMVINKLLDGSITSRFIAYTMIILTIAGTIFWYYLGQVRQDRAAQSRQLP